MCDMRGLVVKHWVVGLDVGGTAVKGALINSVGEIVRKAEIETCNDSGIESFIDSLCAFIKTLAQDTSIEAVGMGIAGVLDSERSMLVESPNLPLLSGSPLQKMLEEGLNCPVRIENDANTAAIGEFNFGAGKGLSNFLFFTLGTGIGAGLILNGTVWHGERRKAGEFGHMTIYPDGELCGCGQRGCLEAHCSGTAIIRMARDAAVCDQSSALCAYSGNLSAITPEIVYNCALGGDTASRDIFLSMAQGLAIAMANVNNLLDIEAFIVGGGISRAYDLFAPMVISEVDKRVFSVARGNIQFIRSRLGNDAGLLGAGSLALGVL